MRGCRSRSRCGSAFLALSGFSLFWSIAPGASFLDFRVLASQVLLVVALVLMRFDERTLPALRDVAHGRRLAVVMYGLAQITLLGGLPGKRTGPGDGPPRFGDDLLGANNEAAALLLPLAIAACRTL